MMRDDPPRGARLERADGSTLPVELVDEGVNDRGIHVWRAVAPLRHGDKLCVDAMPPHSAIVMDASYLNHPENGQEGP